MKRLLKSKTFKLLSLFICLMLFLMPFVAVQAAQAAETSTDAAAFDATLHTTSQAFLSTLDWSAGVYRSLSNPDDQGGILFASKNIYSVDIGNKKLGLNLAAFGTLTESGEHNIIGLGGIVDSSDFVFLDVGAGYRFANHDWIITLSKSF